MGHRRSREQLETITEINMTPLMDLTFLLLIVFMITAPMLEYEVDVTPPQMEATKIEEDTSIMINITSDGSILYEKQNYSLDGLVSELAVLRESKPDSTILIRGDETRPYGEIMKVMREIRNCGFSQVSLVTQAEE